MIEELQLQVTKETSYLLLKTSGYINQLGGDKIAEVCYSHLDEGITNIILDIKDSKVVNSIGISIILEIIERVLLVNGKLIFINIDPGIEKTFTIMGLFQYALKVSSLQDAIELFG